MPQNNWAAGNQVSDVDVNIKLDIDIDIDIDIDLDLELDKVWSTIAA